MKKLGILLMIGALAIAREKEAGDVAHVVQEEQEMAQQEAAAQDQVAVQEQAVVQAQAAAQKQEVARDAQKIIVFDLGDIHWYVSEARFGVHTAWAMGPWTIIKYLVLDHKIPSRSLAFDALQQFPLAAEEGFKPAHTKSGHEFPYVLCAYQAGRITSAEVQAMAHKTLPKLDFVSQRQRDLATRLIAAMFNPDIHASSTYMIPEGIKIVRELAAQTKDDGTKKYKVVALSNWDRESFAKVKERFPEEFALFDDIIISGDIGTIKPNHAAFGALLKKHGFNKENYIFVDDQKENIDVAIDFGIKNSMHFTDYETLRKQLNELGIVLQMPAPKVVTKRIKTAAAFTIAGLGLVWLA